MLPNKLLFVFLLNTILLTAQHDPSKFTTDQEDFRQLYDSLKINHLNLNHYTGQEVFDSIYSKIYYEIPSLDKYQRNIRVKQFVALAGDGHTFVVDNENSKSLPFQTFIFDSKLIVTKATENYKKISGSEFEWCST